MKFPLGLSAPTPMKLTSSLEVRESPTLLYPACPHTRAVKAKTLIRRLCYRRPSLMLLSSLSVKTT